MEGARASKLAKECNDILYGNKSIDVRSAPRFLEALRTAPDAKEALYRLEASPQGKVALQNAFIFTINPDFTNSHVNPFLEFLRQNPDLAQINSGHLLQGILLKIVDPPYFWNSFKSQFFGNSLSIDSKVSFGWLLFQLASLPQAKSAVYREDPDFHRILSHLLLSNSIELRTFGQKIKSVVEAFKADPAAIVGCTGSTPGGRHDNDYADFRQISIVPTPDEVHCKEPAFLRTTEYLQDSKTETSRPAIHLDNQYRLMREDFLYELREELQSVFGTQRRKGRATPISGLKPIGLRFEEDNPHNGKSRKIRCVLELECAQDLPIMHGVKVNKRRRHLQDQKDFLKHQSFACLLMGQELVAFVTIHRDLDRLSEPKPVVVVQLEGGEGLKKAFAKLRSFTNFTLIHVDAALFAYEFVLKALQKIKNIPLADELLMWKPGNIPPEIESSKQATSIVQALRASPATDLQSLLSTKGSIRLDHSQRKSFLAGLVQRVSLIQGPPGTGKSFIGTLLAKAIHDHTRQNILVICYTNHALDDILEGLLDIGIPNESMVRLGGKSTPKTAPLSIQNSSGKQRSKAEWGTLNVIEDALERVGNTLTSTFDRYLKQRITLKDVMEHLEFEDADFYDAFHVPRSGHDGMQIVGKDGKPIPPAFLIQRWSNGLGPGTLANISSVKAASRIWSMSKESRRAKYQEWVDKLESERIESLYGLWDSYGTRYTDLEQAKASQDISVLQGKRIIGCTTTAAAKYGFSIRAAAPEVVLVEEAGEILESHVLTALGPKVSQLILIGDHKQLRPKVNNYDLTVEKGNDYDLNCSLFERLIKSDFPHDTLSEQHRMRPEISDLIRRLTYPELRDAPKTQGRPDVKGIQDNIVFINHSKPEDNHEQLADRRDMAAKASKQNKFEVDMVLKIVRYLGQQGYGTDNLVVLTPYLGQLHKLRDALKKDNDPILNDLDSGELVRAGLVSPAVAKDNKKPIRLATIDNYQGEESDIVIISLTRSNSQNDIGFMYAPERLNVLLSRARNGLIMIGNFQTFKGSRKGGQLWTKLFDMLSGGKHIYEGLPIFCERHPDRKALVCSADEFEDKCPDGGCTEPCGVMLNCGKHACPSKCHNIADHSKIDCEVPIQEKCDQGHPLSRRCHQNPDPCKVCEREVRRARDKAMSDLRERERKDALEREHQKELAEIEAEMEKEMRKKQEEKEADERDNVLRQRRADLAALKARLNETPSGSMSAPQVQPVNETNPSVEPSSSHSASLGIDGSSPDDRSLNRTSPTAATVAEFSKKPPSNSVQDWQRQKAMEGALSPGIDAIMSMVGLEAVKAQVLAIKAKIDAAKRQTSSLEKERFNISFLGNPGTGKTTIARHYSSFLSSVGVVPGKEFVETTGSRLGYEGVQGAEKMLKDVLKAGGGSIFIDEAYQLTNGNNPSGAQVLDFLLAEMENNVGKIVFILAGYSKEMETFFEHNPGLPSRVPMKIKFDDYSNCELMDMFENLVCSTFKGTMKVEDGYRGLYSRVAIRRLGRRREAAGFGNARDLQVLFGQVRERQAIRLNEERREGKQPDDFLFLREDLIGPNPSLAITKSKAWSDLQGMIGLGAVKDSVQNIVDSIQENYERELSEQKPLAFSLNRVFLGSPGTGKTTVAKLYGQILADLGLLSKGEVVVKNPSDFTGSVLGESEKNTKGILNNSVGKVLVIDEAYMLYGGGGDDAKNQNNQFKTSVIDTIVAEVQNVPGDDRCVLLLGYEQQMVEMFNNVNPGLARRFKVDEAFKFEDFTEQELLKIMEKKMVEQDVGATDPAKKVALELLSRAKNRPNFGNGGEVENLLSKAKEQCLARRSKMLLKDRPKFIIFEPEDFDKEYNRAANASVNLAKLFEDIVGHDDIVNRLANYQTIAKTCRETGRDPRDQVPTNFVFTGPPGTGKTTIARKIGSVYFDMGFLSSKDFIECSASDLVGQYVGQTGPKTRKLFEKALGKVLFIDEAYRLGQGHFAQEAVDELVGLLTNETYKGKIIVILAGYEQEMNGLMKVNTGLSSRFPEWVPFKNISTKACIDIILKQLKKGNVSVQELLDEQTTAYSDMVVAIDSLSNLPDWGNARDMITLSKDIINFALLNNNAVGSTLLVTGADAVGIANKMLQERFKRSQVQPKIPRSASGLPQMSSTATPPTPPPTGVGTGTKAAKPPAPPSPQRAPAGPPANGNARGFAARGRGRGRGGPPQPGPRMSPPRTPATPTSPLSSTRSPTPLSETSASVQGAPGRDAGVSDEVWSQLQAAKRAAEEVARKKRDEMAALQRRLADAEKKARLEKQLQQQREKALAEAKDAARRAELERQKKEAEEKERRLREERDRIARLVRAAQQAEAERKRKEEAVQRKLRSMGVCPVGFQWIPMGNGYRCAGGTHFVSSQQLGFM